MLRVPKVTISVGSLNRAMKKPLINPKPTPIVPAEIKASQIGASGA